jgi:uncharacterized protein (DUF1684 family)
MSTALAATLQKNDATMRNTELTPPATQTAAIASRRAAGYLLLALTFCTALSFHGAQAQSPALGTDGRALDKARVGQAITLARAAKDSVFRSGDPDSPIPLEARAAFAGLAYFDPDPAYSLTAQLHRYGRPRQIPLLTNTGTQMVFERFGRLFFLFDGNEFWLEVHRNLEAGEISIFFTDATNGEKTYRGGRYVPLTELGDGLYLINFNRAYNPYCAYNPSYICPMPPAQNSLPFAVLSGERSYGPDVAEH